MKSYLFKLFFSLLVLVIFSIHPPVAHAISFTTLGINQFVAGTNDEIVSSATDGTNLYVGTQNEISGGKVWKYSGGVWTAISTAGFGSGSGQYSVDSLFWSSSENRLYAGTGSYGNGTAQIWYYNGTGTSWTEMDNNLHSAGGALNYNMRSIKTYANNLYVGGSYYFVWKYDGANWNTTDTYGFGNFNNEDIMALESDGTYLYAGTYNVNDGVQIWKYNGTVWTLFNTSGFGDNRNWMITGLKWLNGKLYASTYNNITGTEVWEYGSSWNQINTDGFGTVNNYSTSSIQSIGSTLVVSTVNPTGGQIWSYTSGGGWVQETVDTTVSYPSYMIEAVGSTNYVIGTMRKNFIPAASSTTTYTKAQRDAKGLLYWTDSVMGGVSIGSGNYRFFSANSTLTGVTEGTFSDPAATVVSTGLTIQNPKEAHDYMSGGPIYKDPSTGMLLMFYHAENYIGGNPLYYNSSLGIAMSTDNGDNFYDTGIILKANKVATGTQAVDMMGATYMINGDYFYVYYKDYMASDGTTNLAVARALKSDVIAAAVNKQTVSWYKYYNGGFTEAGLGGLSSLIEPKFGNSSRKSIAWITGFYSPSLKKYVILMSSAVDYVRGPIFMILNRTTPSVTNQFIITSSDGVTWSQRERVNNAQYELFFPSAVSSSMSIGQMDANFSFFVTSSLAGGWNRWTDASLVNYGMTTVVDTAPPTLTITPISPNLGSDATPTLTGVAVDVLNAVASVQYQIDSTSGTWQSCTANDGAFDGPYEPFTCTTGTLSDGKHTMYIRATDSLGNVTTSGQESSDSFTIDTTAPASFSLIAPSGYTKDEVQPTLVFKKSSDTNGVSSYSVSLDPGKNLNYEITGIPASGNGTASYIWKDDASVKVVFVNEQDNDPTNDEIHVYFKGLDKTPLSEGKHTWRVVAKDPVANERTESKDFLLDRTNPSLSDLILSSTTPISVNGIYTLRPTDRMPSISGVATDLYQGSTVTNPNGSQDTFDPVSSGPKTLTLMLSRLQTDGRSGSTPTTYLDYLTQEYDLTKDVQDDAPTKKLTKFTITPPFPLIDGYYRMTLILKDQAGNTKTLAPFYLSLNDKHPILEPTPTSSVRGMSIPDTLTMNIAEEEKIPATTEEDQALLQQEGTTIQVKVVNDQQHPIPGAKVTIHSKVQEGVTDTQGIVTFSKVEPGSHTIAVAYDNFTGNQQIAVTGDFKEIRYVIMVKEKLPTLFILLNALLIAIITLMAYLLLKRRRDEKEEVRKLRV